MTLGLFFYKEKKMEKEKAGKSKTSITAWKLMDYVEEQLELNHFSPDDMDKMLNGLWAERTTCTVREHLTFDDVRGSRIIHYGVADAFYELFKIMQENDLTINDLECYPNCWELPYPDPIIHFTAKTKEHEYKYYPVMLFDQFDSEKDEYVHIKDRITDLKTAFYDSNPNPEENG
jgi:hypothetical protein